MRVRSITVTESRPRHRLAFATLAVGMGMLAALVIAEIALRSSGHEPWKEFDGHLDMPRMHEPDPDLGWRSKEGRYVFGTTPIHMTFWPDHTRATAAAPVRADAAVVVLGCSFVQGWALSDEETFAWKLQERFARARVLNFGTAGYGTTQSLLALERYLEERKRTHGAAAAKGPLIVVYGFSDFHTSRSIADAVVAQDARTGLARARRHALRHPRRRRRAAASPAQDVSGLVAPSPTRYGGDARTALGVFRCDEAHVASERGHAEAVARARQGRAAERGNAARGIALAIRSPKHGAVPRATRGARHTHGGMRASGSVGEGDAGAGLRSSQRRDQRLLGRLHRAGHERYGPRTRRRRHVRQCIPMPHQRRPGSPRVVVDGIEGRDTLYEVELWAAPSPPWRAAFLRPPPASSPLTARPRLAASRFTGRHVHFRAAPRHLTTWLRRIDRWIGYANSVVAE